MSKPRISYVDPSTIDDPAMIAEFERCAREGTPRPESQAIRAHVPATFWSFANTWRDVFKNGVADHKIKELCRIYVSRSVLCEFCGNQRSIKAAKSGLREDDYSDLINFESSTRYDERQKAALAYAEAITWDLPAGDELWDRLHKHFSEPELVEIGYFVAITMGQQRWLRTLNIEHHQIMAGTDGIDGARLRDFRCPETFKAGRRLLGKGQLKTRKAGSRVTSQATAATAIRKAPASQGAKDEPRIRVRGLGKHYGALEVFRNIDFDVGEREIVAIVGPSGCGKTTLLRCIDGLLPHDAGEIWVGQERVTEPIAGVAMVFQHFGLFPWKTVFENVAYGLRMAGAPKAEIERKVPEFIKLVGLGGFENAFPYQMSGGMQQRCGLARALAVEPNVLLMDEPFAAVDAQTREILQFELLRIWDQRPTAMIFVTHSIEEAVLLGHRVIVLKGRPSSIHETITIDLPSPRTRETLREPRFAELRERVWTTLMREAREAEFQLER